MQKKRLFLICAISIIVTGCAEFYQPPAPVYGDNVPLYGNKPLPQQKQPDSVSSKPTTSSTAKTEPLKNAGGTSVKPQPLPPGEKILTPAQEQELTALEGKPLVPPFPDIDIPVEEEPAPKTEPKPKPEPEPVVEQPRFEVTEETTATASPFQPLQSFSSNMSPAVNSLVIAANEDSQKGNNDAASSTLERASRIEPRNGALYYKMAVLKLKTDPSAAENLAKKSAILAGNDTSLKKHSWLLVAKARELQKNYAGAKDARATASKF